MRSLARLPGVLTLVFSAVGMPASVQAQSDDWEVVIAPYVLFGNLSGESAVGVAEAIPLDLEFGDLLENMRAGAIVHSEVWKSNWGVMADLIWLRLGTEVTLRVPTVLDLQIDEIIAEGLLAYRFPGPGRQVDLFAGVRYWDLAIDLELVDTPSALDLGDSWIDPVVGGRIMKDLAEDWFLMARGDIGGFGLGSTLSWNLQGGIGWDLADWFSLVVQYKALDVDFENEEAGMDFLSYQTTTHGPVMGFVFHF